MKKLTTDQAAQKLVEMIGLPNFTEDMAHGYVEMFLDIEFNFERDYVEELDMYYLLDAAGEDGWLD